MDPEVAWRVEVMRAQMTARPSPIPFLRARLDVIPADGTCVSCGDAVPVAGGWPGRCAPCAEAARAVIAERHP